jgi:hypothetical protein
MTSKEIPIHQLHKSPIRHAELPPALVERVERVVLALSEVYPSSLAEWLDDLQRDVHPEQEVLWWENLTRGYVSYRDRKNLNIDQRHAAFQVFFAIAMDNRGEAISGLAALPEGALADIEAILRNQGI